MVVGMIAPASIVSAEEEKTITVWAWDDNFNVAVMKEAAEVYAQVSPESNVNIDVRVCLKKTFM